MKVVEKILDILPIPFWVYFLSIVAGTVGILPHESFAYDWTTRHVLPVAIVLMLVGAPLSDLVKIGPKAMVAMAIGTGTIFFAQIFVYVLFMNFLPGEAWKAVGALMGTWIGGSANMVAVKEILGLSDGGLSILVIVDTLLSYAWMAFLLSGAKFQKNFDEPSWTSTENESQFHQTREENKFRWFSAPTILVIAIGFAIGELCVMLGKQIGSLAKFFPTNGWTLLCASTLALLLALTPLKKIKRWGTQNIGTLLLYLVLITIGAKTTLTATLGAPIYLLYGVLTLGIHGVLSVLLGKYFQTPFFLLATASQANIGGAVSAPIVSETYRLRTAHIGVLMAVFGAVLGTYLGVAGGYLCRSIYNLSH